MGLYHFGIYLLRRKEMEALYFALGCMIGAVRVLFVGEMYYIEVAIWTKRITRGQWKSRMSIS